LGAPNSHGDVVLMRTANAQSAAEALAEQVERHQAIQTRLDHAIEFVMRESSPTQPALPPDSWRLLGNDQGFRDELFCDTVGVEMVEASIAKYSTPGSPTNAMAFEAILFTAVGLELLRVMRRSTAADKDLLGEAMDALLGREFIRSVCLNLLAQKRFFATEAEVARIVERIRQTYLGEDGVGHLLARAEEISSHAVREAEANDRVTATLEKFYRWKSDPTALKTRQIY
jgi:hypothetical protein